MTLASLFTLVASIHAFSKASVPPPAETPAIVIVSGQTSTAVAIKTLKVGQQIPKTYAGDKIHNLAGFDFYVSQHYALQTNMGDAYATNLLEVAELAYPHWVDEVGAEPPDPDTRMYMVYASTADLMKKAISNDTGLGPPSQFGGGITIYANHSAYNYPSGSLQYHQRALAIHENLHMLQMVVYGTGGLEDFTYSSEQSVYDTEKKQLTVRVFDKATINNWTDVGLAQFQKERPTFTEMLAKAWNSGGGPGVTLTQFYWTDPDRYLKWQIWRDEFYLGHINKDTVAQVTESIFGPLAELDKSWQAWLTARHNSFHYVDWGWEQDGNTLWSYGFPQRTAYSETDLLYKPADKATYDPYRMDYPSQPVSRLVGPTQRGSDEPSVGVSVDFSRNHGNGIAGMGLGVIDATYYAAMIQGEGTLAVFSQGITDDSLALPRKEFPLPGDLVAASKANGHLFGITLRIADEALEIAVRAGADDNVKEAKFTVSVTERQRNRMLKNFMAVLAKSNSHGITPYIDDGRKPAPDLTKRAAPNFWRYEGLDRLETLYKAAWRLGSKAPASLVRLKAEMLQAVEGEPTEQAKSIADYESRIVGIALEVQTCDANPAAKNRALTDLTGTFLFNQVSASPKDANLKIVSTTLINRVRVPISCSVSFSKDAVAAATPSIVPLEHYRPHTFTAGYRTTAGQASITYRFDWRGTQFSVVVEQEFAD